MKQKSEGPRIVGNQALEYIMRDVFDGLVEITLESAYKGADPGFEIIEISSETPRPQHRRQQDAAMPEGHQANIIDFPQMKRACG